MTTQGQIYSAIVQSKVPIQDNVLRTMAQNNDVLVNAVHNFTRMVETCKPSPKLFCFFEQKATKIGLIAGIKAPAVGLIVQNHLAR